MTRTIARLFGKVVKIGTVALSVLMMSAVFTPPVKADEPEQQPQPKPLVLEGRENDRISSNGDGKFHYELILPAEGYAKLKKTVPDAAVALRKLGFTNQESVIEGLKGVWVDDDHALKADLTARGAARMNKDGSWGMTIAEGVEIKFHGFKEGVASLSIKAPIIDVGSIVTSVRITLPEGATDVKLSRDRTRLTWKQPEPLAEGKTSASNLDVDTKKYVMGSLAKVLSNRKFGNLWTARSIFKNTGDQLLKDYRVRFRMAEFTPAWSQWSGTPVVVPGQSVVDTYFPILDLEKVAKMTGQTKASVEIQWQYTKADGKVVEDSDTKELTVLARNQVQYSSMKFEESADWSDNFDMSHIVMGCFVTHEDPVIQQAAGRICKSLGGNDGSLSDEAALKFMEAAFNFMGANIAYQTSPGNVVDHKLMQHVKYGRDVLRNKAGTCIDLAILYGSLCESVGLKPVLFNIPGHCFPGVYLPISKKLVTVEATAIGKTSFAEAVNYATEKNMKPIIEGKNPAVPANIVPLHAEGVNPIDLPVLADDVLEKWGITFDAKAVVKKEAGLNNALVGNWQTTFRVGNVTVKQVVAATANGDIAAVAKGNDGSLFTKEGKWSMRGKTLTVNLTDGSKESFTIAMDGKDDFTCTDTNGLTLYYTRIK